MATAYLKIENPGVAPAEAFTLLGASTKRDRQDTRTIGKFGSGNKHGVAVCLRNDLDPVIFAGNLRMSFGTRPVEVDDGIRKATFQQVVVKYGGKDEEGRSKSATEDLGYVLEYGSSDWVGVELALREFISNAIDRATEQGEVDFLGKFLNEMSYEGSPSVDQQEMARESLREYRKTAADYKNVTVEVVNENQVRAKSGYTRVFVPLNEDVLKFFNNLGRWFLHFSEPDSLDKRILPKKNRNLEARQAAVIYRKGVRVREFESDDTPSLFDYNLDDLELDEARKVDDWRVRYAAGRAFAMADAETLATVLGSFQGTQRYWEHAFDQYGLQPDWRDDDGSLRKREETWQRAVTAVAGENAVVATGEAGAHASRKGYSVLKVPESFAKAAEKYGVRSPEKVLSQDDREGREIIDATPDALAAMDFVWDVVFRSGMTNGKCRPEVKVFRKIMEGGAQDLGFHRDGVCYLNADIAGYGSIDAGQNALSQQLLVTTLEEVSHYVTGATDTSRDFQDYVLNLAVKLMKAQAGIL
jgi:hypothetical protein